MARKKETLDGAGSQLADSLVLIKQFYPVVAVGIIVIVFGMFYITNTDIADKGVFTSQNANNFYNTTAKVSKRDEKIVLQHLNKVSNEIPPYIKQYVVRDADAIAVTITVKYSIDESELNKIYYTDSKLYKEICNQLIEDGFNVKPIG